MTSARNSLILCGLLWLAFTAVIMFTRPALPTSETRALTVAWEMFARNDFITMTLNYAPYSHKPPLLPWLIYTMWLLFGVSKAAATIVTAAASFSVAWLTQRLAQRLWPQSEATASLVPWLFLGLPLVIGYGHLILYDFLLSVFVAGAMLALICAATTKRFSYFLWLGLCIGMGGLSKGPAILLHVLPAALLIPFWKPQRQNYMRWYGGVALALLIGFAVALAWAIPAALRGGPEYAHMIFFGQSTGRIVNAFDHAKPWWFYGALLPVYILPWICWPSLWRSKQATGWQQRFLASWAVPVFIAFSAISGKQIHYLFPVLPAFCLWLAARLQTDANKRSWAVTIPLIVYTLIGLGLSVAPWLIRATHATNPFLSSLQNLPIGYGGVFVILCCALLAWSGRYTRDTILATSAALIVFTAWMHIVVQNRIFSLFDLQPIADVIRAEQLRHPEQPLAYLRTYEGDFGFLAGITRKIDPILPNDLAAWHQKHPQGLVISCLRNDENRKVTKGWTALKEIPFRSVRTCGVYRK